MEGPAVAATTLERETPATRLWRDGRLLLALLVLSAGLRAWSITHTEVASRDSIGFIRYAYELETLPLQQVLQNNLHHPGYPAVLLAVSVPVRHWCGGTTPTSMQLSAQLTSALTGLLLIFPMFYLGRMLFDRGIGFWAALLFQCLPVSAHLMADGLSDPTYLLIVSLTLLAAIRALRGGNDLYFALAGVGAGLAYLIRPEGPLLAIATGLVLLGGQAVPAWRRPWSRAASCAALLLLSGLVVGEPYAAVIGTYTLKTTARVMMGDTHYKEAPGEKRAEAPVPVPDLPKARASAGPTGRPLIASIFAVYHDPGKLTWGLQGIGFETSKGLGYFACVPALLGLWWFGDRFRDPAAWLLLTVCLLQVLILWRVTYTMGYVSERHVMILAMCGTYWAVAAVRDLPRRLAAFSPWLAERGLARYASWWSVGLLVALVGCGLPSALKPLHSNRAGHHAAGLWLAEHTRPADEVYDPFCWSHFYAGKLFQESSPPPVSLAQAPVGYVVIENSANLHPRLPFFPIAKEMMGHGTLVFRWLPSSKEHRRGQAEEVDIYAVPIEAYRKVLSHYRW